VLAIWHTIAPEAEPEYWRWHDREHIPERVGVPGFLRGRRYRSLERPLEYLDFYETADVEVLRSAPYLARLNDPTPWTRRVVPYFRDTLRIGYRRAGSAGRGIGGVLLTARLGRPGAGGPAPAWLGGAVVEAAMGVTGVVAAHVLEAAPAVTSVATEERRLRGPGDRDTVEPWCLLVEADDPAVIPDVRTAALDPARLDAHGVPGAAVGTFRLQVSIDP
jgi:hypothetical protein